MSVLGVNKEGRVIKSTGLGVPIVTRTSVTGPPPSPNREEYPYEGSINFQGILIYVENMPGSVRSGVGKDGKRWSIRMKYAYGEIAGTRGADGDPIDVYVGPNPTAHTAFVLHQRNFESDEYTPIGAYDEDKVMLGFDRKEDAMRAYAEHYDRPMFVPGCTQLDVAELRWRFETGMLEWGMALVKASDWPPKGGGWHPVPGGKHGGYRRKKAGGQYEYRYEGQKELQRHPKWERDPTRAYSKTSPPKPGDLVEVGGRGGHYRVTPEHGAAEAGQIWVTSLRTGENEQVRTNTLVPIRPAVKKKKPPQVRRKQTPPERPPEGVMPLRGRQPVLPPVPPEGSEQPSTEARRAAVYGQSEAKEGSYHHRLENGHYMLRQIKVTTDKGVRFRDAIHIPEAEHEAIIGSFAGLRNRAINKIARSYRLDMTRPEVAQELAAAAAVGLWYSFQTYAGGKPFLPHAYGNIKAWVIKAARSEFGRGTPIPDRMLRNMTPYVAAKTQARTTKNEGNPSPDEIAKRWRLNKGQVFQGTLGSYAGGTTTDPKVIDQATEAVPAVPWRIKGPDGEERGKPYPGKLALIETMESLLAGDRVQDSEWMLEQASHVLPNQDGLGMHAGTAIHIRMEIENILEQMQDPGRTALIMQYGLHAEDREPASVADIAAEVGITGSAATQRRKVAALLTRATQQAQEIGEGTEASRFLPRWGRLSDPTEAPPEFKPLMPAHSALRTRFGSDEAVYVYQAAIRAGHGDRTAKILDKIKAGTATDIERTTVYQEHMAQRNNERLAAFQRQTQARAVDPSEVRDVGPQSGPHYGGLWADYAIASVKET